MLKAAQNIHGAKPKSCLRMFSSRLAPFRIGSVLCYFCLSVLNVAIFVSVLEDV